MWSLGVGNYVYSKSRCIYFESLTNICQLYLHKAEKNHVRKRNVGSILGHSLMVLKIRSPVLSFMKINSLWNREVSAFCVIVMVSFNWFCHKFESFQNSFGGTGSIISKFGAASEWTHSPANAVSSVNSTDHMGNELSLCIHFWHPVNYGLN